MTISLYQTGYISPFTLMVPIRGYPCYIYYDGGWITMVPKLPGCFSDGETIEEALKSAEEVIGEWLDTNHEIGRKTPKGIYG